MRRTYWPTVIGESPRTRAIFLTIGNRSALISGLWDRALCGLFHLEDTDSTLEGAL